MSHQIMYVKSEYKCENILNWN